MKLKATGAGLSVLSDFIEKGTDRHLGWEMLNVTMNTVSVLSLFDNILFVSFAVC